MFDIKAYYESRGIKYWVKGKNVGRGWINIQCPFCADTSNHLGFSTKTSLFSCFICAEKGGVEKLIQKLEECKWGMAKKISRKFYSDDSISQENLGSTTSSNKFFSLPKEAVTPLPKKHLEYLKSRRFNPRSLTQKYGLMGCNNIGKYKFRVIAPCIVKNRIVNFIARDVTNKSKVPYLICPDEESIIPKSKLLYNIDTIQPGDKIIVVEGITDVWRLGNGTVATLGKVFSLQQIAMLISTRPKTIGILYDADDEIGLGRRFAEELSVFHSDIRLIEIEHGDPAEMTEKEVTEVWKQL